MAEPFYLLLESGSPLLLESGSGILLESSVGVPDDLAGAIQAAYAAAVADDPGLSTDIYNGVASDNATYPHTVFRITSGGKRSSSDSYWIERKITFDCLGDRAVDARKLADGIADYVGGPGGTRGIRLRWSDGVTTRLVLENARLAAEKVRGKGNSRVFRSSVEYSCWARLGVPTGEV